MLSRNTVVWQFTSSCSASLRYNALKEDGAIILAEGVRTATRLHTLKYVMTLRCKMLRHTSVLHLRSLGGNDIKATGTDAIAAALAEADAITSLEYVNELRTSFL
jgi:hypothetical protein